MIHQPISSQISDMSLNDRLHAITRAGFWTPEQSARFDAIRNSQYCLVRIDGVGERWRCRRCNCKHSHFSLFCISRPFRGLLDGLHAYWANVGGARDGDLSPAQRERLDVLTPIFGKPPVPLATTHPSTAAVLATDERDVLIGGTLLGSIDPISRQKAALYVELINSRARHRVLTL